MKKFNKFPIVLILLFSSFYLIQKHIGIHPIDINPIPTQIKKYDTIPITQGSIEIQDPQKIIQHIEVRQPIEINTADSLTWSALPGIGPYRTHRILKFRQALGGFISVEQVGETYGLPDSVFQMIKSSLQLHTPAQSIDLNTASYDELYQHPYITKQMAYYIKKHQQTQGPISNFDSLKSILLESHQEKLEKLKPYLNFNRNTD